MGAPIECYLVLSNVKKNGILERYHIASREFKMYIVCSNYTFSKEI